MPSQLPESYNTLSWTTIRTTHHPSTSKHVTPIIILTLHRPKNHNAFTSTMMQELETAYTYFNADERVKCIVFTGHGRIFCAGADLDIGFVGGQERVNDHRDGYVYVSLLK
jgi:enoyl-CoA hydratase/carnithine racemase